MKVRSRTWLMLAVMSFPLSFTTNANAQVAAVGAAAGAPGAEGATIFVAQKCSLCHAIDGKGNAKGALDEIGSKLTADEIRKWIVNPVEMTAKAAVTRKPAMKAYDKLPKADLDALVGFLAAKKKK